MASLDQNFYNTTALGTPIDPPDDSDDNLIDTPHSPLVSPEILESFFVTQANPPGDLPLDGNLPVKKKFTDLLEENGTDSVQDDVITKIFSQTIQVPTSDEATPTTDEEEDKEQGETGGKEEVDCSELKIQTRDKSPLMMGQTTPTIVIDTCTWTNGNEEDSDSDPPDKVPHNLAHFNETICDDEDEDLDHHHQMDGAAEETIQNSYDNEQSDVRLEQPNSDPQSEELIPEPNPEEDDIQEFEATERKIELEEFENEKNLRNISYDSPNHDDFIIRNDQSEVNSEPVTEEMPNDSYYKEDATEEEKSTTDGLVRRETKSTTTSSVSSSTKTTTIKRSVASKMESMGDEETVETEIITTEMEEAQQTQGSTNKKKRKSKKLKNSDGPEKENISVVQNHDSLISSNGFYDDEKSEDSLREPEPRTFTSVRQLRKFYQERCRMEKERSENKRNSNCDNELTNTRYSVKSLCRSFIDLMSIAKQESQFSNKPTNDLSSSTLPRTVVARWPPQSKTQIIQKSSFSKFDALQKKAAAAAAAANALIPSGSTTNILATTGQEAAVCAACGKTVYQMEQIKAEMRFWHRNCFRCSTCQKPLSVDTYQSHEAILYCKPHFKQLFHPKAVLEDENEEQANQNKGRVGRLPEMIIRENQPAALPEGVVRATDKVDDGLSLDDLQRLSNVKQAFKMFESRSTEEELVETSSHKVEKSPSILNKLAHFQNKMNGKGRGRKKERVGVTANDLNGEPRNDVSGSSSCVSSEDEDEPPEGVDVDLWRARKAVKSSDQIVHCSDLDDLKRKFEANSYETERQDRQEERKEELKKIRSRLFMGKQARIKEQYQQAVMDSEFVSHLETESTARKVLDDPSGVVAPGNIREKMQLLNEGGVSVEPTSPTHAKQRLMEQRSESLMELEELRQKKKQANLDIKSKFESGTGGSTSPKPNSDDPELMQQIVEHGIAKTSRNLFLELDKQVSQTGPISPLLQPASAALRKSNSQLIKAGLREDGTQAEVVNKEGGLEKTTEAAIVIDTKDLQKKFEFFEKYQEAPKPKKEILITKSRDTKSQKEMWERQVSESANAQVRQEMPDEGKEVAMESHTARKMLNLFREIESGVGQKGDQTEGPRPLKAFTPPPDGGRRLLAGGNQNGENGGGEEEDEESDAGVTDNSDIESEDEEELKKNYIKYDDEILQQAKAAARAKKLRAKFEKWETEQIRLEQENGVGMQQQARRLWESNESHSLESNTNATNGDAVDANQLESAKNLRQKFEFMAKSGGNQPTSPRGVKINRFV